MVVAPSSAVMMTESQSPGAIEDSVRSGPESYVPLVYVDLKIQRRGSLEHDGAPHADVSKSRDSWYGDSNGSLLVVPSSPLKPVAVSAPLLQPEVERNVDEGIAFADKVLILIGDEFNLILK